MFGIDIFEKGGVVMVILAFLSVYGLAIIFFKAYQFFTANVFESRFVDHTMGYVKRGELTDAQKHLQNAQGPVARIMRVAIDCVMNRDMTVKSREAEITRVGASEIRYLESHMRGLEMIATTAPLLGLLGTVIGMVIAFSKLGEAGSRVDPSMLAGGIWEALLTTVGGLAVAIPAVAAYYLLDGIIEKVRSTMQDVTVQILALEDRFIKNEKEQAKIEQESIRDELREREDALRKTIEEQEEIASTIRTTAQSSSTLKLLNPSYR